MLTLEASLKAQRQAMAFGEGRHYFDGRHEHRRAIATDYRALQAPAGQDYTPARIWNDETKTFDWPPLPERPDDEPGWAWCDKVMTYVRL